jgi:thymidylate kinase
MNYDIKNKNGFYLVLEGVDFCGKSTIANELVKNLSKKYGHSNVVHKKDTIKNIFIDEEKEKLAAKYMLIDRIDSASEISQLLKENKIVVQERNFLTALVYSEATKKDKDEVKFIIDFLQEIIGPDILALVNISDTMLDYRINKSKENQKEPSNYETFEKAMKRKKEYFKFGDYINIILPNDNKESLEDNLNSLEKIVSEKYQI